MEFAKDVSRKKKVYEHFSILPNDITIKEKELKIKNFEQTLMLGFEIIPIKIYLSINRGDKSI